MKRALFLLFIAFSSVSAFADAAVKFSASTGADEVSAGETFQVALKFEIPKGSHIYGPNESEIGSPTTISFEFPKGQNWKVGKFNWPEEKPFSFMGIDGMGYSEDITVTVQISAPSEIGAFSEEKINVRADWLECSDLCVPAQGESSFTVLTAKSSAGGIGIWGVILSAFLGGMILNLMPCVFPVIGIKILSFAQHSNEGRRKALISAFIYAAGIILSFLALAGALEILRHFGKNLGWGFQLQNPVFTGLMALLFFAMALSFAGLFEIGVGVSGKAIEKEMSLGQKGDKYLGAFGSGVLAVLVASPCTAPFMGSALGVALTAEISIWTTFAIFASLGAGMAFPYVLLSAVPAAARMMPKPGKWMEVLKKILSVPLFATVGWLGWIFYMQTGSLAQIAVSLAVLAIGLFVLGRFASPHHSRKDRRAAALACLALAAVSIFIIFKPVDGAENSAAAVDKSQQWSLHRQDELLKEGRIVYVDFTASWCLTCQYNKTALHSAAVQNAFKENDIALLIGDWTNKDPAILEELKKFGRAGVPLNILYSPDPAKGPIVLPAILSESAILEAIDKIKQ